MIAKLFHFLVYAFVALFAFTQYTAYRIRKMFPPEGKFVDVGADRLHYVEYGEGPPIVFVHGLCGQLRNFAYLDLQRLAKSHRVILVDRPGSGRSTRGPRSSANVYAQARTIAMFIATLGLDKPVVVGHSLGGAISLALALNHPQSVSRIALIAPLTHTETEPPGPFAASRCARRSCAASSRSRSAFPSRCCRTARRSSSCSPPRRCRTTSA